MSFALNIPILSSKVSGVGITLRVADDVKLLVGVTLGVGA